METVWDLACENEWKTKSWEATINRNGVGRLEVIAIFLTVITCELSYHTSSSLRTITIKLSTLFVYNKSASFTLSSSSFHMGGRGRTAIQPLIATVYIYAYDLYVANAC